MKKFYKVVSLSEPAEAGYSLLLDGKAVQTPARQPLRIRALPLAETVANEWRAQKDEVLPDTMPLSQMAMTLIDRVLPHREKLETEALGYLDTDLVCYRAEGPPNYKEAQEKAWDPFIKWFSDSFDTALLTTTGLSPLTQSAEVHQKVAAAVRAMNDEEFMPLYLVTLGSGSLIMALAFVAGEFSPAQILAAAFAEEKLKDEIYLGEIYGSAPDQERRYAILSRELETLQRFLILCLPAI